MVDKNDVRRIQYVRPETMQSTLVSKVPVSVVIIYEQVEGNSFVNTCQQINTGDTQLLLVFGVGTTTNFTSAGKQLK